MKGSRRRALRVARLAPLVMALAAATAAGGAPGCYGATEVSVTVTTTVACSPALPMTTQLFTGATGTPDFGTGPAAETTACGGVEPRVGTLSIVPTGARDDRFDLEVVGAVGVPPSDCRDASLARDAAVDGTMAASFAKGCVVARRRVSFRPHKSLTVPVLLSAQCVGVVCGEGATCDLGVCTSVAECTDLGCPREVAAAAVDGGAAGDGEVDAADAALEASLDASADAVVPDAAVPPCRATADVVVSGQAITGQLAQQGTDLLYIHHALGGQGAELRRVPKRGGAYATVASQPQGIEAVAASANNVAYVAVTSATQSAVHVIGSASSVQTTPTTFGTNAIAIAGNAVVGFTITGSSAFSYRLGGQSFAVVGTGTPSDTTDVATDEDGDFYAVLGGTTIFHYGAPTAMVTFSQKGTLAPRAAVVADIAAGNRSLFVAIDATTANPAGIHRIARAGLTSGYSDPPLVVLSAAQLPQTMATDGVTLYYIAGTTLALVPVGAAKPATPMVFGAPTSATADRLLVDGECLYWVEGSSSIMKRAKP